MLNTTATEKDIGVTIQADLKVSEQCDNAARKGNQLLGMITSGQLARPVFQSSHNFTLFSSHSASKTYVHVSKFVP